MHLARKDTCTSAGTYIHGHNVHHYGTAAHACLAVTAATQLLLTDVYLC